LDIHRITPTKDLQVRVKDLQKANWERFKQRIVPDKGEYKSWND